MPRASPTFSRASPLDPCLGAGVGTARAVSLFCAAVWRCLRGAHEDGDTWRPGLGIDPGVWEDHGARRAGSFCLSVYVWKSQLFTDGHDTVPYSGTVVYRCHIVKMEARWTCLSACLSVSIGLVYRSKIGASRGSRSDLSAEYPQG